MPVERKPENEPKRAESRRPRGTGRIFQKHGNWYGQWHGLTRKLGPVRPPGSREGLTRGMAEARLRDRRSETANAPPRVAERTTVGEAGRRRITDLARKGRKVDTTLANYESEIRVHFEPHFGETPISQLDSDDIERVSGQLLQRGSGCQDGPQPVHPPERHLRVRRAQAVGAHQPVRRGREAASASEDAAELRFLDQGELEALLAAAAQGPCRHSPETLERGAKARSLRAQNKTWRQVGVELGVSGATALYLSRAAPDALLEDELTRSDRVLYLVAARQDCSCGARSVEGGGTAARDCSWCVMGEVARTGLRESAGERYRDPRVRGTLRRMLPPRLGLPPRSKGVLYPEEAGTCAIARITSSMTLRSSGG